MMSPIARKVIASWMAQDPPKTARRVYARRFASPRVVKAMQNQQTLQPPPATFWACGKCGDECAFQPGGATSCCGHKNAYAFTPKQIKRLRQKSTRHRDREHALNMVHALR